jgi:hypothetical protein
MDSDKIKFIIMTTSIIRPTLHNISIKKFYDTHYTPNKDIINDLYEIYHIINIDQPEKLKQHFTLEQTIDNFDKIIPEDIIKIYITTETPAFLQAFINIMCKIKELDLLSPNNIYWWFEDDWITNNTFNTLDFFNEIIQIHKNKIKNYALTMTQSCPIGSFRGGPIMSGTYFMNYFNIVNLGCINDIEDPEVQVRRHIACNKKNNIKHRQINDTNKNIDIIIKHNNISFDNITVEFYNEFYNRRFNRNLVFTYHIIIQNKDEPNILYYMKYNINDKDNVNKIRKKENYTKYEQFEIYNNFIHSTAYFMIFPIMFDDCGRQFATKYNLIKKWKNGGITTYK